MVSNPIGFVYVCRTLHFSFNLNQPCDDADQTARWGRDDLSVNATCDNVQQLGGAAVASGGGTTQFRAKPRILQSPKGLGHTTIVPVPMQISLLSANFYTSNTTLDHHFLISFPLKKLLISDYSTIHFSACPTGDAFISTTYTITHSHARRYVWQFPVCLTLSLSTPSELDPAKISLSAAFLHHHVNPLKRTLVLSGTGRRKCGRETSCKNTANEHSIALQLPAGSSDERERWSGHKERYLAPHSQTLSKQPPTIAKCVIQSAHFPPTAADWPCSQPATGNI
ncbi:hypothetical protein EDB83DRAFT_2320250 [Lactarius deliciosus]|nr:hypothetical protein EDB83DRAFT_2320250 [Lactarius deliciosus]